MKAVRLEGLEKTYPDGTRAVIDLNLEIEDGEFVVFVGPSGCGKTTALRMIAGLETITAAKIRFHREANAPTNVYTATGRGVLFVPLR